MLIHEQLQHTPNSAKAQETLLSATLQEDMFSQIAQVKNISQNTLDVNYYAEHATGLGLLQVLSGNYYGYYNIYIGLNNGPLKEDPEITSLQYTKSGHQKIALTQLKTAV